MNEAQYWRQRYEMLMANFADMAKLSGAKTPVLLADKESYEAGRIAGKAEQPVREWVGLTDEEFQMIYDMGRTPAGMMEMVEAKLKEKNT